MINFNQITSDTAMHIHIGVFYLKDLQGTSSQKLSDVF